MCESIHYSNSYYRWGQKNFPHEEYGTLKNKTIEISKDLVNRAVVFSKDSFAKVKKFSTFIYEWVSVFLQKLRSVMNAFLIRF